IASGDAQARITFQTGSGGRLAGLEAIESLGQDPRHRRLSHPARAIEQVSVCDPAGLDGALQRFGDVVLSDDVVEGVGAVAAGEDSISHGTSSKGGSPAIAGPPTGRRSLPHPARKYT